jgi:ABC-type transport system involved in multi-copper enzyme maturation permease subunit
MSAAIRYELRRITTIRATWILSTFAVIFAALFAFLFTTGGSSSTDEQGNFVLDKVSAEIVLSQATFVLSLVFLFTIASQSFGHEYRYGMIRLTLTAFPIRSKIFAAKVLVVAGWCAAVITVSLAATWLVTVIRADYVAPADGLGLTAIRSIIGGVALCLMAFAIATVTRNIALGVVVLLVWGLAVENLLSALLTTWNSDFGTKVSAVMPYRSTTDFIANTAQDPAPWISPTIVMVAWVVVLVGGAWLVFSRRDA